MLTRDFSCDAHVTAVTSPPGRATLLLQSHMLPLISMSFTRDCGDPSRNPVFGDQPLIKLEEVLFINPAINLQPSWQKPKKIAPSAVHSIHTTSSTSLSCLLCPLQAMYVLSNGLLHRIYSTGAAALHVHNRACCIVCIGQGVLQFIYMTRFAGLYVYDRVCCIVCT